MRRSFLVLLLLLHFSVRAQNYPAQPSDYVTDDAGVLSTAQKKELNNKLGAFEKKTSNQVFVYVAPSLNGTEISSLCQEIFRNWKIGGESRNNGVLIAVFVDDHKFRIHTGYGLEGALPDLLTKRIQDNEMRPQFKTGDYFGGLDKGIDQLIYYSENEFASPEPEEELSWVEYVYVINILLLVILIFTIIFRTVSKKKAEKKLIAWGIFLVIMPVLGTLILLLLIGAAFGLDYKRLFDKPLWKSTEDGSSADSSWFGFGSSDSSSSSSGSDSDSSSGFDGGGGGDSGGGGSSSDW